VTESGLGAAATFDYAERPEEPARRADVVMNFGCGVQQTPHLMSEAIRILRVSRHAPKKSRR
jgi:hypothetical protein